MPYKGPSDLPKKQFDQYTMHGKRAAVAAFNNAYKEYGGDEGTAFAVAHTAAQQAEALKKHRGL
jgi:cation transport regulator ChaB